LPEPLGILLGVILFGLLHGINPSHGWTVAVLYSIRNKRPLLSSLVSSGIIAGGHFLSSMVVVMGFILLTSFVQIPHNYTNYAVAVALGVLAFIFWREKSEDIDFTQHGHLHDLSHELEHEHEHWHKESGYHNHIHLHQKRVMTSLAAIAGFAIVLGFAHEEEFVILSLAVGGINPVLLMIAYALAVTASLIGVTVLGVKVYTRIEHRVLPYVKYLPKISALILAAMAIAFALGVY
jgi:nickel/cobalt transporter (NicO) family protein